METKQQNRKEIEIDVIELLHVLFRKIGYVILCAAVCGIVAFLLGKVILKPQYESTTSMYVLSKTDESSTVTSADLNASALLARDCVELVKSREVAEDVIEKMNLHMGYQGFVEKINVSSEPDTRIVSITVKAESPELACQTAETLRESVGQQMRKVMQEEGVNLVYGVVDEASQPKNPVSPNMKKIGLLGVAAGAFLAIVVILLVYIDREAARQAKHGKHRS